MPPKVDGASAGGDQGAGLQVGCAVNYNYLQKIKAYRVLGTSTLCQFPLQLCYAGLLSLSPIFHSNAVATYYAQIMLTYSLGANLQSSELKRTPCNALLRGNYVA